MARNNSLEGVIDVALPLTNMRTLFPLQFEESVIPEIPGLAYLPNYITAAEEARLVEQIDAEPWDTSWERRRQPYGESYGSRSEQLRSIPDWGRRLLERMDREGLSERPFDQMLVNEYLPGQGIALHCDYEPFDRTVVSLSLLSSVVMDFRKVDGSDKRSLLLAPRSLLVLSDVARYDWQHGIARRKTDRWLGAKLVRARRLSVTFRLRKRT